jgi:hypothetical protein
MMKEKFSMGHKENQEVLLKIHNITTGTKKSVEEIVSQRTVEPDITLVGNSEAGGKINFFGKKVSVGKYYFLGDNSGSKSRATKRT